MSESIKPLVAKEDTFDKLDIRLGQIVAVEPEPHAPKPAYKLTIDFGKFGKRVSVGRFTGHTPAELTGQKVMAVLNFAPRLVGQTLSEVLVLGVQFPKADSGSATPLTPLAEAAKIGGKMF